MVQHMNEDPSGSAPQMIDSTANNNDGTSTNFYSATSSIAGQIDGSLYFDGGSDYVDCGSENSLNFTSSNFTIDLWVKVNSYSENKIYAFISNGAFKEYGYYVYVDNVGRIWLVLNQDLARTAVYTTSGVITLGEWQHLVFIRNGSVGEVYIDSVDVTAVSDSLSDPLTSSKSVRIGNYESSNHYFNGTIDSVRISNTARSAGWIETEYNNQSDVGCFMTIGGEMSTDWYNTSWKYRRQIDINSSQIATTTSDFPILATTTLADLKTTTNGGKVESESGYDIIFVDSLENTLLNFEREYYASTTGEIVYWIKTDISSTTDKMIYMYYGNSGASDLATTTGVWDENFVMVQHMNEDWDASSTDSTQYDNDGTHTNFYSATSSVDAQIDGGIDFDGDDDCVDCGNALSETWNEFTFGLWMKPNETSGKWMAISEGANTGIYGNTPSQLVWLVNDEAKITTGGIPTQNQWYYLVGTFNNGSVKFYRNTENVLDTTIASTSVSFPAGPLLFGRYTVSNDSYILNGTIDEVRISNIARSAGWIETEYNNQSDVGSFMAFGAVETTIPKYKIKSGGEGGIKMRGYIKFR